MTARWIAGCCCAIFAGMLLGLAWGQSPAASTAGETGGGGAPSKIKVLIVDGFSNHDWKQNTRLLRGVLEPTGLFELSVSTSPPTATAPGWDAWRPRFSDHDVVLQTCNDINRGPRWPADVRQSFAEFVRRGGGVMIYHSAQNAFADWPEYNEIIALGWRPASYGTALRVMEEGEIVRIPPGEGRATGHGAREAVLVRRRGEHPIHAGFPRAWKSPGLEVYYHARGPAANVDVISYGQDPRFKEFWPVEWTVTYGEGRVYVSTFGHVWAGDVQPESLRAADVQTIVPRALQWLAKRPVTVPVPADFPTEENVSVRGEIQSRGE